MITTLEAVKLRLRIPSGVTDDDDLIRAVLEGVEAEILGVLHLSALDPTEYTLTLDSDSDGDVGRVIRIEPRPVISVDSVEVSGQALAAEDYQLEPTHWLRLAGVRGRSRSTGGRGEGVELSALVVVVTAGFAVVPPLLALGAAELAAARTRANPDPGVVSEQWGRYAIKRSGTAEPRAAGVASDWPASLLSALGPYLDTSHTARTLRVR